MVHHIQQNHVQSATQGLGCPLVGGLTPLTAWPFWPANLAWELTPPIALGVTVGIAACLREGRARDLILLAALPAALFSLEGVGLRFHPLARFTMPTAVLLMPYAGEGLLRLARGLPARWLPATGALAIATGLGLPGFLAWWTPG